MTSWKTIILGLTAAMALADGLTWSGRATLEGGLTSSAEARVGRPATPMSYAGVARRTTRRAVAGGAAVAAGAYAATSACRQVVNSYGQITTRC